MRRIALYGRLQPAAWLGLDWYRAEKVKAGVLDDGIWQFVVAGMRTGEVGIALFESETQSGGWTCVRFCLAERPADELLNYMGRMHPEGFPRLLREMIAMGEKAAGLEVTRSSYQTLASEQPDPVLWPKARRAPG